MNMPERGQDYSYLDSANLLVHLEDEVSQLMKFLTLYYVEMEENICRYALLSWMNRLC